MGLNDLVGEIRGDVEVDEGVLVIKRIHAAYKLRVDSTNRDAVERVRSVHADACPVARSLKGSIDITTSVEYV